MNPKVASQDLRSAEQQRRDDAAAADDWTGFETEQLLTDEGAHDLLNHQRTLAPGTGAEGVRNQPFRWRDQVYRVLRCEVVAGTAAVEVSPPDAAFAAELKRRVEADRFHHLDYCQGFGFVCFPEDYPKYKA